MKRLKALLILFFLLLLWSESVFAKGKSLQDTSQFFFLGGNFLFTDSAADDIAGAAYAKKMTNPLSLNAGIGFRLFNFFYLGARYEMWMASRDFTLSGIRQEDSFRYQAIGGELGIYRGNPRFFWILSAGWFHPLSLSVESTRAGVVSSTYTKAVNPVTYQARLTLSVKLNSRFSIRFEGGYRYANFGNLVSGSTSFLPNGESLDLGGPFVGAGLGIHF